MNEAETRAEHIDASIAQIDQIERFD